MVIVPFLTVRNLNKDYERNEICSQILHPLVAEGIACLSRTQESQVLAPAEKEQTFVRFSLFYNPFISIHVRYESSHVRPFLIREIFCRRSASFFPMRIR